MSKKLIQYEVWKECHNHCKFCFLAEDTRFTPREVKLDGIKNAEVTIDKDIEADRLSGIGIIGGDFWQGELTDAELKTRFFELLTKCFTYLKDGLINEVWLTATLTIGDQHYLYEALDLYQSMIPESERMEKRLWVCTSYDTIGRFHTPMNKENWETQMKFMSEKYPTILKNTSIIITNDLVKKTLNDEFDVIKFKEDFGTEVYFKTPSHHLNIGWEEGKKVFNEMVGDFFLERVPTILWLQKVREECPEVLHKIMNNELRADVLVGHSNTGNFYLMSRDKKDIHKNICLSKGNSNDELAEKAWIQDCMHEKQYQCYIDSDKCFMCDLQRVFKVL